MRVELGLRLDRVIFDANRSDIGLATNASRPDIGRATIDEITLMLKDEATEPYAAGALGLIGPSASSAIPALEEALIRATISDARVAQEFGIYPPSSVGDYVCPALRKIGANPEPPHCDGDNYKR